MVAAVGPFGLGPMELVIILLVLVLVFGATRVADLGAGLGKGIREFRKNVKDEAEEEPASASPAAGESVSAVKCPSCGSLNPLSAKHCSQCGAGLAAPVP